MSAITAAEINKLRQATGAGMMDCRKALTETNGDFEAAIDWLRKQGQKVAAKRSDREAKEGVIIAQTSADHKTGFVVCISCETDFVSKNAEFVAFAQTIADAAVAAECGKDWSENLSFAPRNLSWPEFGCSSQHNLAAIVEDPRDLERPRTLDKPDALRRSDMLQKYRKGEPTFTKRTSNEDSGTVSDVAAQQ
jgi:translation elongation factor EF-Ts